MTHTHNEKEKEKERESARRRLRRYRCLSEDHAPERDLRKIFTKATQAVLEMELSKSDDDKLAAVRQCDLDRRVCLREEAQSALQLRQLRRILRLHCDSHDR